jgi:hypothetical protein
MVLSLQAPPDSMGDIMDPYADEYELLARHPPPSFETFSAGAGATNMDAINQMDDYLRAIGALPPRPPADFAPAPGCNYSYTGATNMDFDAHVQQFGATEFPAAPLTPASDNDADMEMEVQSPEYLDTTQGGQTDLPSSCSGCASAPSNEHYILDDGTVHFTVTRPSGRRWACCRPTTPSRAAGSEGLH